jgi:hypothetical protein
MALKTALVSSTVIRTAQFYAARYHNSFYCDFFLILFGNSIARSQ